MATVREYLLENPSKDVWLCPHISSSDALKPVIWEYGQFYSDMNKIPTEILDAELVKHWVEDENSEVGSALCLIWHNWRVDNAS